MTLPITQRPLSYVQRLEKRSRGDIDLLVVHCTELPDLAMARVYGERVQYPETGTGNSGHFYIDRDGNIEQWVPLDRVAHHVRGFNPSSVGVELVNSGRYPHWFRSGHQHMREPYPERQVSALKTLVQELQQRLAGLEKIAGHEELDTGMISSEDDPETMIRRKVDPGPLFPWPELMAGISLQRLRVESL